MQVLRILRSVIDDCARVISFGAKFQEPTRKQFVSDLRGICSRCDDTYSELLKRLGPIKATLQKPDELAAAIRSFAVDTEVRKLFKPERLCGEIDVLLTRMQSNLDPLKYSIDMTRISAVLHELHMIGNYDAAIRGQFDQFVSDLDKLAIQLAAASGKEKEELATYARDIIKDFEAELNDTVMSVRNAKTRIVG